MKLTTPDGIEVEATESQIKEIEAKRKPVESYPCFISDPIDIAIGLPVHRSYFADMEAANK